MKWYFVLNESAHASYVEAAKVSALSCIRNTSLEPHILYDGGENEFTADLRRMGVTVHLTQVPFLKRLFEQRGVRGLRPEAARGAYLRTMIPTIERDDDFVLYTDSDVVFERDPTEHLAQYRPRFLAATAEADLEDSSFFNSGVMVMNVRAIRRASQRMFSFIGKTLPYWGGFSPNDQGSLNYFFRGTWEPIDPRLNWKPYWGPKDDAWITHHHGNRVGEVVLRIQSGIGEADTSATRRRIYTEPAARWNLLRCAQEYIHYLDAIYDEKTRIVQAIVSGADLKLEIVLGGDVQFLPFLVLDVIVDDVRLGEVAIPLERAVPGSTRTCTVSLADVAIAETSRLHLKGRDLTWIAADAVRGEPVPDAEQVVRIAITAGQGDYRPIAAPAPAAPAQSVPGKMINRVWTLPDINTRFSAAMDRKPFDFEQMFKWNSTTGPLELFDTAGDMLRPSAPIHNEIRVDPNATIPERIHATVAQLAGFEALKGEAPETYRVQGDSELESDILRRLGVAPDPVRAIVGAPEPRVRHIIGNGEQAGLASIAIDKLVRPRIQHRSGYGDDSQIFLQNETEHGLIRDLAKRARNSGYVPVRIGTDYRSSAIRVLMGASLIVVADDRLAALLVLAAPHASVIHVALPGSGDVVRHLCSMRNLLYARIDLTGIDDARLDRADLADSRLLLSAISRAATTMLESNVATSEFADSPAKLQSA